MGEEFLPDAQHERRITWGLMAVVVAFVLVMTGIVLWIMTSLIRFENDGSNNVDGARPPTLGALASVTDNPPKETQKETREPTQGPILVDATWTPAPSGAYIKFLYWYVKPSRISVGECIQLTWEIANAVNLKLYRNDELILDDAPLSKTLQDCPTQPGYAVYRMVGVNGAGMSNFIQLQVKVNEAP